MRSAAKRPNIVFITSHDTGTWLSCYGRRGVSTPELDRLSGTGVRLAEAYCVSPICSPSLASIRAVIYPAETEYLYFYAKGDGSHAFARTYEEHLQNQALYGGVE